MEQILTLILPIIVSLISVNWIFLKILSIAKRKGLVDSPNARKLQRTPVPMLGGLAVIFGLLFGVATYFAICKYLGVTILTLGTSLLPVMICCSIILYVGVLDDILGLSVKSRLVIEVLTMVLLIFGSGLCVDSFHGLWGVNDFSRWLAVPLTVFAGVGIINAYNMVDGVNGLSSGLCICCSVILGIICYKRQDWADCILAFCFATSLVPFWLHNVFGKRSRMFIGDGGTMVMGLLISWFVIRILSSNNATSLTQLAEEKCQLGLVAMMLAVVSVPVFDTLRVMIGRIVRNQSPFKPDKTHLHHVFVTIGVSHLVTALCEIMLNVFVCGIWYITYKVGASVDMQLYVVVASSILLIWGMYFYLNRIAYKYPNSPLYKLARATHLSHTTWWLTFQHWLDRGAYEDFSVLIDKKPENMDPKEKDTMAIVNYLQGKKMVKVEEILSEAGAERLRVYLILFELEQSAWITVIERSPLGEPLVVKINPDALI